MDLQSQGPVFTWFNHQSTNPIVEKLERILGNDHWLFNHGNVSVIFEEPLFSNHASCCIRFPELRSCVHIPFRFNHHLMQHPRFLEVVQETWLNTKSSGSLMIRIGHKPKALKRQLKELDRSAYSGIQIRTREALDTLKAA